MPLDIRKDLVFFWMFDVLIHFRPKLVSRWPGRFLKVVEFIFTEYESVVSHEDPIPGPNHGFGMCLVSRVFDVYIEGARPL